MIDNKYNVGDEVMFLYSEREVRYSTIHHITFYGGFAEYNFKEECGSFNICEGEILGLLADSEYLENVHLKKEEKYIIHKYEADIENYKDRRLKELKDDLKAFLLKTKQLL